MAGKRKDWEKWPGRPTVATVNIEDTLFLRQETWARTQYTAPKQDQKWRARDLVDIHSCGHSLGIGGRADAVAQLQPNHVVHHRPCEPDNRPLTGETKLIAAETGYCVKTVSRAIDWWVAHGFLIEDIGLQSRGHIVHSGTSSSCIGLPSPRISKLGNRPPPMDILDRGYGRPPQHLTGEDAPVYVARLPEPCKMAEEWEALVKARWSLPSDQASSKPEAQIEGCRGARVYSWKPKKPWATRDSSMAVYVGSGLGSEGQ